MNVVSGIASARRAVDGPSGDAPRCSDERRGRRRVGEAAQDDPSLYFNRELSWLDFNDRVLQLAEDERVPLLERVKFCAIYTTNLDEYYMVRVAGLRDQIDAGVENPSQDGLIPSETIALIRERVLAQGRRLTDCFEAHAAPGPGRARHPRGGRAASSTRSAARSSPGTSSGRSSPRSPRWRSRPAVRSPTSPTSLSASPCSCATRSAGRRCSRA